MPASARPHHRVFLSYAWEDQEYRSWVERLAARLHHDWIDVRLDAWHGGDGSIPDFMSSEIRLAESVLVLCSPLYRQKVHAREEQGEMSGVGWEAGLLTSSWFSGNPKRVVLALCRGKWQEAAPDFLVGHHYYDLSQPSNFEDRYRELLLRLNRIKPGPPARGPRPPDLNIPAVQPLRGGQQGWNSEVPPEPDADSLIREDTGPTVEFSLKALSPGAFGIELRVNDEEPLVAPFALDLRPVSQPSRDLAAIRANSCQAEDIQNLGSELWTKLLPSELEARWDEALKALDQSPAATVRLRLGIAPELEDLPWEALYDYDQMALATSPRISLVRSVPEAPELQLLPMRRALRLLVVIPSGSGLSTCAEWERIQQNAKQSQGTVDLHTVDGCVTLGRLAEVLREDWDIVHFIGHGRVNAHGKVELRFNAADDQLRCEPPGEATEVWVSTRQFVQEFRRKPPRLVVLNCCHAGSVASEGLSGLGRALSKARVPAVLLMRYEIRDAVAAEFADVFYRELLSGDRAGRVDLATQEGRAAVERTFQDAGRVRSYITPALYLATGCEQLFQFPALRTEVSVPLLFTASPTIDPRIPAKLLHAIANRSCLPIIGPGVLSAGAERGSYTPPPGPSALAQELARISNFPAADRLTPLTDSAGEWLTPLLLERICQHFESEMPGERGELNRAVQNTYRPFAPSPTLEALARWQVPGMVYTYIDGLLEQALRRSRGRDLRVAVVEKLKNAAPPSRNEIVLLHLRGAWNAAEDGASSMVLTEEDEDRVLDNIGPAATFVADLMNRVGGCTLVFIGVSARDPLARALARSLLRPGLTHNRGTAFFAASYRQKADEAYWKQFPKTDWLEIDEESLIQGLSLHAMSHKDPT